MSEINDFYNEIKNLNTKNELPKEFKTIIRKQILTIFPNLKNEDIEILSNLTIYIVNTLKIKFLNQEKIEDVIRQFTQNNFRDIKKVTLLLIPFIDDKDDNEKSKKVKDLNMILYNIMGSKEISNTILEKEISDTLKQEFLISNFAIGLLNDNKGSQLVLKNDKDRLIDKIIYNNFIGLLETLKIVTGKLYVNWFNISPINENNYEEQEIFKRTQELSSFFKDFSKYNNHSEYIKFEQNYGGLWVGDLYNVFRKGYYSNVKKDKWLIYNKNKKYYIQILDNLLNLDNHLDDKYKTYIDLPLDDKIDFEQKFENTVLESKTNSTVYDMLKNILIFMVNNYSNIPLINLKNQDTPTIDKFRLFEDLLSQNDAEDEDGEFFGKENKNKIKNITKEDVYLAIKIFKLDDIWNYLKEAIVRFKSTIYFTFLNKNNKIDQDFFYFKFNKDDTEEINLKNLYNIGKLLSHDYLSSENPIFQENYISLNEKSKIVFLEKFFMGTNWIKISKNLRIEEIQTPENTRLLNIVNIWNKYKINFVFLYLIRKGILSKFKSDFDITDKNSLPRGYVAGNKRIEKLMEQKFKNNKEWNDSYYYLTNKKYSDLDSIRIDDPILKIKNFSYFDLVSKEHKWFKFYAMDWLTQISFFHTYINHQILYVTGATGQGKSTQVPKLLMYAMKMFDYKENGKIVCTQPRVPPTVNNAERISEELGVPIIQPSKTSKEKIKTDNYFVQYKHSKDSHVDSLNNNLSLKIETDGTLFSELKQNILMKEFDQFDRRRNDSTSNMKLKNKYDIIIVDEAHEHNKYMDLILTLSRNTCYYNNSIRLIIISATMDDDEPIYRSYFKINNDNLTFPLKEPLKFNPILANNKSIFPQTIFMDRRFHISPPGESTQYKISEKYLDLPENNSSSEKNAKVAQIESYKVVIEICNKTSTGEILLFSTGQAEILDAVEYLNKNLPGGNVALPYFGSMDAKYKNVIEKIDKNIHKIKNKRENIFKEWGVDFIEDISVPDNLYKRAIIVATNVAEASVTIPRLEYVIDNGYSKEATFNESLQIVELKPEKISESSRVQRRGRVGRIADGTVYYLYKKGAREDIKPKYKINQEKNDYIFTSLSTKFLNSPIIEIFPEIADPHMYDIYPLTKLYRNLNELTQLEFDKRLDLPVLKSYFLKNGLTFVDELNKLESSVFRANRVESILNQYNYINPKSTKYFEEVDKAIKYYFPDPFFEKYNLNRPEYLTMNYDGFDINLLKDVKGLFYLIHPLENIIKRNCNGDIIKVKVNHDFKLENKINLNNFDQTMRRLSMKLQVVKNLKPGEERGFSDILVDYQEDLDIDFKFTEKDNMDMKTYLCEKIEELSQDLTKVISDDDNNLLTLVYAHGNEVIDEVVMIFALLRSCNYSLKRIASSYLSKKGTKIFDFQKLKLNFPSERSDIESLYKICNKIKSENINLKVFNLDSGINLFNKARREYESIVVKYQNALSNIKNKFDPPESLSKNWNLLNQIKSKGILGERSGCLEWISSSGFIEKLISEDLQTNLVQINKFCKINNLNSKTVFDFFYNYFEIKKEIFTIDKNIDEKVKDKNPFNWFNQFKNNFSSVYGHKSIVDKVVDCFIFGYSGNLGMRFDINRNYNLDSSILLEKDIEPLFRGSDQYETFLNLPGPQVIFLKFTRLENLSIITNVNSTDLIITNPLYFNAMNFRNLKISSDKKDILEFTGPLIDNFIFNIKKNKFVNNVILRSKEMIDETSESEIDDILNNFINYVNYNLSILN